MSLYTLYCERCQRRTTHDEVWDHESHPLSIEHPRYDTEVLCRDCEHGRSKADVPAEGMDVDVTAKLKVTIPAHIDPDAIRDDESIYEYAERLVRENRVESLREVLSVEDVESAYIEREEGTWPNP